MPRAFETCLCPAHLSPTGTPGCTIEALVAPETHQLEGKQVGKKDLRLLRCRILQGDTRRSRTPCLGGDLPQLGNIVGEKSAEQVVAIQFTGCVASLLSAFQHRSNKPSS